MTHVQGQTGCSERRACAVLGQHRSTQRYERRVAPDESALVGRIEEIVRSHLRYGYRMDCGRHRARPHRPIGVMRTATKQSSQTRPSASC